MCQSHCWWCSCCFYSSCVYCLLRVLLLRLLLLRLLLSASPTGLDTSAAEATHISNLNRLPKGAANPTAWTGAVGPLSLGYYALVGGRSRTRAWQRVDGILETGIIPTYPFVRAAVRRRHRDAVREYWTEGGSRAEKGPARPIPAAASVRLQSGDPERRCVPTALVTPLRGSRLSPRERKERFCGV